MHSGNDENVGDLLDLEGVPASSRVTYKIDEILGLYGSQFLENAYRLLLVREPEGGGRAYYLPRLLAGVAKIQILAEIAASKEAQELAVNPPGFARAFLLLRLARLPLIGRIIGWLCKVEGNTEFDVRLRSVEELLHQDLEMARSAQMEPARRPRDPRELIAHSGLFDADWYRQQTPELSVDDDPIDHFLTIGGVDGRSPSKNFDCAAYLARYFDVRRSGMNPLIHFLLHGEKEGRSCISVVDAMELKLKSSKAGANHVIQCLKSPEVTGETAILVTRAFDGHVRPYVRHYIAALKGQGIGVVVVLATDTPVQAIPADWASSISGLFVRESRGDNFAAWAQTLQMHPELFSASILYLLDDSVFGPLNDEKFARLTGRIRASPADVIRLTNVSDEQGSAATYFLALKARALASVELHRFIDRLASFGHYAKAGFSCEFELSAHLGGQGINIEVLYPSADFSAERNHADVTLSDWKKLIESGFPFVRVAALTGVIPFVDNSGWRQILSGEAYDLSLVDAELISIAAFANFGRRRSSERDVGGVATWPEGPRLPSQPLRVALIGPSNFHGREGFAGRGYISALWHTDFLLNFHPIRQPFHQNLRITPAVDCRSFSGDADLVIAQLNPDEWPGLFTDEHWEILSRAHRVVGAWACEEEEVPASWYPAIETVDSIWAPSRYAADVFERSTKVPVDVVPYCVAVSPVSGQESRFRALRGTMGILPETRIILSCLDGAGQLDRRNPLGLIAAYAMSGLVNDGWVLAFKIMDPFCGSEGHRFLEQAQRTPGVIVIDERVDIAMLDALMNIADIYASAHRTEISGTSIAQAMARGKSVIATDYGGNRDFLDSRCGYPVPYSLRCVQGRLEAEVDTAVFADMLRQAAQQVAAGDASIGHAARERINKYSSPREIARSVGLAAAKVLEVR